ncbi:restriction endonuclease subunit S [Mycoplasma phocoeninasale]|uniref:restriction endonuclease subunit S n=1 Tax=Mycoplasma phocoeninasale TaxID=2726117 RepID=UPI001EFFF55E|nr:restriction endonuclease subunit S [Mycoplasma phocoeninasale]
MKKIKDICAISRGKVYSKKYIFSNKGKYPLYSSNTLQNGELGKINTYDYDGSYVSWTTDGANAGTIFYREGKFSITNICEILKPLDEKQINTKFLSYILSTISKKYVNQGLGNPKLMSNVMENIEIPILPIEVQKEIVEILDKLSSYIDELITNFSKKLS